MSEKELKLLLKDLSSRLPYGVYCQVEDKSISKIYRLTGIHEGGCEFENNGKFYGFKSFNIKPLLRRTTSMTKEEVKIFTSEFEGQKDREYDAIGTSRRDWLLENHFDFRGLIEKGLALEATEGMY